ncbi:MAG: MraY family glycosyltransferase [Candidatus Neomarinimicrobiota bacterium]
MSFYIPFISAFVITLWFSFLLLKYAPNWLIDIPTGRKTHNKAIPMTGGIAFGLAILLGTALFSGLTEYWWYLIGGITIYALGAIDDYRRISWHVKLVVQLSVATLIIYRFVGEIMTLSFFNFPLAFSTPLLILIFLIWFVGILNAVNLIDGMDGLAGGSMVLISFFAVIIGILNNAPDFIMINAAVLGALAGFLHFNQKPARFFMGDSGSLLLGFHVACLPLLFHQSIEAGSVLTITPFLILASFLIMDTTRVFFSRILKKQNPMTADTIHLHHLMFRATNSYMGTLVPIFLITWLTGVGSIFYYRYSYDFLAVQVFLLVLILFVFLPPVPFYVPIVSRFIQRLSDNRVRRSDHRHWLRIRFVPFLGLIYFISLMAERLDTLSIGNPNVYLLVGLASLIIFSLLRPKRHVSFQVLIMAIVLLQGLLLISGEVLAPYKSLVFVRFGSLAMLGIITIGNYIENSSDFGLEFWSVIDLLVLLIFAGLALMSLNGIDVSLLSWTEVIIVYYASGLYAQRRMKGRLVHTNL